MCLADLADANQAVAPIYCAVVTAERFSPERFAEVLRSCRERTVGTQEDLSTKTADEANGLSAIDAQTISNIERGKSKDPRFLTVVRLVLAMGLTLSEFFLQIERGTDGSLQTGSDSIQTSPSKTKGKGTNESGAGVSGPGENARLLEFFQNLADLATSAAADIIAEQPQASRSARAGRAAHSGKSTQKKTG
jgi:transcriptional regulator with XRE-family HTH domain